MNEISELMYVSDIDTYDLLFINDVGKKRSASTKGGA
mgnify:CR=1 FL=1